MRVWLAMTAMAMAGCSSGSSTGTTGSGETWKGTFTGTASAAQTCAAGADPTYHEAGTITFTVPAPGLEVSLGANDTGSFPGTYANTETVNPGATCTSEATPASTPSMAIVVNQVGSTLQVNSTAVLIKGHFQYDASEDELDATQLILTPTGTGVASINGTWSAAGREDSSVFITGQFSFQRQ